jgi:hypothetical protein
VWLVRLPELKDLGWASSGFSLKYGISVERQPRSSRSLFAESPELLYLELDRNLQVEGLGAR